MSCCWSISNIAIKLKTNCTLFSECLVKSEKSKDRLIDSSRLMVFLLINAVRMPYNRMFNFVWTRLIISHRIFIQ